ncbi:MAG TPA: efflux RND transporter periplasmic adaptor subunit [Candidatus Limnocylindrales bacterium]|nr:efflux RND transporter periplasmic adaptor subunit [Candidatus Limnocylindrales bacterium]
MNASSKPFGRSERGRASTILLVLVAAVIGVLIGMRVGDRDVAAPGTETASTAAATDAAAETEEAAQLWTCGMHPQVVQDHPGECPICHMELTPLRMDTPRPRTAAGAERNVKYWWDPMMNPPYISREPGKSPMGMDLLPVYEDEVSAGAAVVIDPVITQNMGLRTAKVREGVVARDLRLAGFVKEAEPGVRDINLRVSGWVQKLYADTEGMHVRAGDPLFELYSPDLQVAVEELIALRKRASAISGAGIGGSIAADLRGAAVRKLELYGLPREEIDRLARMETAPGTIMFRSPITGHVTEKMVVQGSAVEAGEKVLRIVDHTVLWIDAQVFEQQLGLISHGQRVRASVQAQPGQFYEGEVTFIHPHVSDMTRTALVRTTVSNPSLELRPGMFADVHIHSMVTERGVMAPRDAVIDTGQRQVVFVMVEGGRFEPREVLTGSAAEHGMVQILKGLAPGETVVVSGQFLLDAESRLQEALRKYLDERKSGNASSGEHAGHGSGAPVPATSAAKTGAAAADGGDGR